MSRYKYNGGTLSYSLCAICVMPFQLFWNGISLVDTLVWHTEISIKLTLTSLLRWPTTDYVETEKLRPTERGRESRYVLG